MNVYAQAPEAQSPKPIAHSPQTRTRPLGPGTCGKGKGFGFEKRWIWGGFTGFLFLSTTRGKKRIPPPLARLVLSGTEGAPPGTPSLATARRESWSTEPPLGYWPVVVGPAAAAAAIPACVPSHGRMQTGPWSGPQHVASEQAGWSGGQSALDAQDWSPAQGSLRWQNPIRSWVMKQTQPGSSSQPGTMLSQSSPTQPTHSPSRQT